MKFEKGVIMVIIPTVLTILLFAGISIMAYQKASALEKSFDANAKSVDAEMKNLASRLPPLTPLAHDKEVGNTTPNLSHLIALGFVAKKSGHGVEWALKPQLVAYPAYWGFKGDPNDKAAVDKWANRYSVAFATRGGYVETEYGAEVRVNGDLSFVLQKDEGGKIHIDEYVVTAAPSSSTVSAGGKDFSLGKTHTLAKSIATAQCFGSSATTGDKLPVPQWEYVYFPGD
jgi:hypothetical protein